MSNEDFLDDRTLFLWIFGSRIHSRLNDIQADVPDYLFEEKDGAHYFLNQISARLMDGTALNALEPNKLCAYQVTIESVDSTTLYGKTTDPIYDVAITVKQ